MPTLDYVYQLITDAAITEVKVRVRHNVMLIRSPALTIQL